MPTTIPSERGGEMSFNDHLRNFSWLTWYTDDPTSKVLHVQVEHRDLKVRYEVLTETMHTRAGQQEFMRLAFANREKLKRDWAAVEAVTARLTK